MKTVPHQTISVERSKELDGIFRPSNVGRYVEEARETMNFLSRWQFDITRSKELKKQVSAIARDVLIKQREQMQQKLMLSLDAEKKRLFVEYMKHVDVIQQDMVEFSAEAAQSLTEVMYKMIDESLRLKGKRLRELAERRKNGEISDDDYDEEYERTMRWSKTSRDNVEAKVALILEKQARAFEKTIELFKTEHGI